MTCCIKNMKHKANMTWILPNECKKIWKWKHKIPKIIKLFSQLLSMSQHHTSTLSWGEKKFREPFIVVFYPNDLYQFNRIPKDSGWLFYHFHFMLREKKVLFFQVGIREKPSKSIKLFFDYFCLKFSQWVSAFPFQ